MNEQYPSKKQNIFKYSFVSEHSMHYLNFAEKNLNSNFNEGRQTYFLLPP